MDIKIKRLNPRATLPCFMSEGSAGMDLFACLEECAYPIIWPGRWVLIPTGWAFKIPGGYEGQIRSRSGLAYKRGITVLNSPGTIDSDYRGELKVMLINHGGRDFQVENGMRIAQLVISPIERKNMVGLIEVDDLGETERGAGGFGSTGG